MPTAWRWRFAPFDQQPERLTGLANFFPEAPNAGFRGYTAADSLERQQVLRAHGAKTRAKYANVAETLTGR